AGRVIRIKDPREGFGLERLGDGTDELPVAERSKVEVIRRARSPEAKRIDCLAAVTDYRPIIWNTYQARRLANDRMQTSAADLKGAVQLNLNLLVRPLDLPWVLSSQPVVRLFLLPAITDRLLENAIFVAQPVAHGREFHCRHGVEKAGCESSESAVTQPGVRFLFNQPEPIKVSLFDGLFHNWIE